MKSIFLDIFLLLLILNIIENNQEFLGENDDIVDTISTDDESAFLEAVNKLNEKGGTIYINTTIINISIKKSIQILGKLKGGIIGLKQPNNQYPIISFKNQFQVNPVFYENGMEIIGSYKYIKYLIFEHSANYAISIYGEENTIDHVITRYNGDGGIQVNSQADFTIIKNSYSYRNCNWWKVGIYGEGFYSMKTFGNEYKYCYAWDNCKYGFRSHENSNIIYIEHLHSAAWNNDNSDVFTGKYDYDQGKELDKNMVSIQEIIKSDPNYESNYNSRNFNIDNAKVFNDTIQNFTAKLDGSNVYPAFAAMKCDYCASFDHNKLRGIGGSAFSNPIAEITNCASFNNEINYGLDYRGYNKWNNNWGWNGKEKDIMYADKTILKPSTKNPEKLFYSIRDQIIKAVQANTFPDDNINFDSAIMSLKE